MAMCHAALDDAVSQQGPVRTCVPLPAAAAAADSALVSVPMSAMLRSVASTEVAKQRVLASVPAPVSGSKALRTLV